MATELPSKADLLHSICGTPGFGAPEMLNNRGYGEKVDIYAAGIVLFIMISGKRPFRGKTIKEIVEKNKKNDYTMCSESWEKASTESNLGKLC